MPSNNRYIHHIIESSIDVFQCIHENDLLTEIKRISVYKSSGIVNMPSYLLKMWFQILTPQLLVIMNK